MTKPKRHIKGQLAELCRRTTQRKFFLRPGEDTRKLFGYLFAKAANDYGQEPCVSCLLSNHHHTLVTDPNGRRSDFMQQMHSNVTRKRNLQINRRESLWNSDDPGDMAVLDLETAIERVLYVVLQPVAAGLVERVSDWTGFLIRPSDWGKKIRFERIDNCGATMPEVVEFTPQPPPGFRHLPLDEVIAFFEAKITEKEEEYAKRRRKSRKFRVQGIRRCERTNPFATPKTPAPMRVMNPKFTGRDPVGIARAIRELAAFRQAHLKCREAFLDGVRDVVFPSGTIQFVSLAGVECECEAEDDPHQLRTEWTDWIEMEWSRLMECRAA